MNWIYNSKNNKRIQIKVYLDYFFSNRAICRKHTETGMFLIVKERLKKQIKDVQEGYVY